MSKVMHDIYRQIMNGPHQKEMEQHDQDMRWAIVYFALYDPEKKSPRTYDSDCEEIIKNEAVEGATIEERKYNALAMMRNISIKATLQDEKAMDFLREQTAKYQESKRRRKESAPNDKSESPTETSPKRP